MSCKIDWVPVSAGQGIEAAGRNFLDEGPGDLAGMLGPVSEVSEGEVPRWYQIAPRFDLTVDELR